MQIIQKRKTWFLLSGALCGISILLLATFGLQQGIDFTGGTLLEVKFNSAEINETQISKALDKISESEVATPNETEPVLEKMPIDNFI